MRRLQARHWKLSEEAMALLLKQLDLRMELLPYEELARQTGMTKSSVRVTMWNLMRERRRGSVRIHRGTAQSQLNAVSIELNAPSQPSNEC